MISLQFLITHLELDLEALKQLEQFLKIKIHWVKVIKDKGLKGLDQLDMRKLLFKIKMKCMFNYALCLLK